MTLYCTENFTSVSAIPPVRDVHSSDVISFSKVDIVTPSQKMLARELIFDIKHGGSLLVTGWYSHYFICFVPSEEGILL